MTPVKSMVCTVGAPVLKVKGVAPGPSGNTIVCALLIESGVPSKANQVLPPFGIEHEMDRSTFLSPLMPVNVLLGPS